MEENMNDGKSYEYFASLANMYPANVPDTERPWDYAMKLDDDSFLNIPRLLDALRPLVPRAETWFVGLAIYPANVMVGPRRSQRILHVWSRIHSLLGLGNLARRKPGAASALYDRRGRQNDLRNAQVGGQG